MVSAHTNLRAWRGHSQAHPRADQFNGGERSSDLIGMTVNNCQDAKLAEVDDLAMDDESGRIV